MKKLSILFALIFSASMMAFAAEEVVYTLNYASAEGGGNAYAEVYDVTIDDIAWSVPGNATMDPARIGGKSLSAVDRVLYSKTAIEADITKVVIEHGNASGVTVNSVTLTVYASAANAASGSNPIYTVSGGSFAANASMTFNRPEDADWYGCYFRIVYNITITSGSNKFFEFKKAEFYAEEDSDDPQVAIVHEYYISGSGGSWYGAASGWTEKKLVDNKIEIEELEAGAYEFKLHQGKWSNELNSGHVMVECRDLLTQGENSNIAFYLRRTAHVLIEARSYDGLISDGVAQHDSVYLSIELEEEVDHNPIVETYFGTLPDWVAETESYAEWNESEQTAYVHINQDKTAQWLAQVKIDPDVELDAAKAYDVSFKLQANKNVSNVTFKYQQAGSDNAFMILAEGINLTSGTEYVYTKTNIAGYENVNTMIFDFGFASANTVVAIYDIEVKETEETGTPDYSWRIAGNGNDCNLGDGDGIDRGGWCDGECWQGVALTNNAIEFTNLPAATYQFKLLRGNWHKELNYSHVMAECLNRVQPANETATTGNVYFIMEEVGDVHIEMRHFGENKDSIYISGDMKLNEEPVVDMGPIVETYFADDWNPETDSYAEWNADMQVVFVYINHDKHDQWSAQVKIDPNVEVEADKLYDVSFKMYAYQDVNNVTFKYQPFNNHADEFAMVFKEGINLEGSSEYEFTRHRVAGIEGVNTMVFDFGYASANSVVAIYDIQVTESPDLYIAGNGHDDPNGVWCDGKNWDPAGTKLVDDAIHYDNLQPGIVYAFKVTGGAWGHNELDYTNVLAECKENFVYSTSEASYGNIMFQMAAAGEVDIVVIGDSIGVYGNFRDPNAIVIESYTMVGSKEIFGGEGDYAVLEANDMILQEDGSYKLALNDITLYNDVQYIYKVYGNHSAMVYEYPEAGYYMYFIPEESGVYNMIFMFYPEREEGYKIDLYLHATSVFTGVDELHAEQATRKLIRDGQLLIIRDGKTYNLQGVIVK